MEVDSDSTQNTVLEQEDVPQQQNDVLHQHLSDGLQQHSTPQMETNVPHQQNTVPEQENVPHQQNDVPEPQNTSKRQIQSLDSGLCDKYDESDEDNLKRKRINQEINTSVEDNSMMTDSLPSNSKFKKRNYRNYSRFNVGPGCSDEDASQLAEANDNSTKNSKTPYSSFFDTINSPTAGGHNGDSVSVDYNTDYEGEIPDIRPDGNSSTLSSSSSTSSRTSPLLDIKSSGSDSDLEDSLIPSVLLKEKPKHKWSMVPEILQRQFGSSSKKNGSLQFQNRMYGSLHTVQRLELMYKLETHNGCVNFLNFNQSGDWLASCSDDLTICIWDWPVGKLLTCFDTGHKTNVFQVKFLPLRGNTHICTCARDGQVRIIEIGSSGAMRSTKRVAQHRGPANKLAIQNETPHVFLSCGEDAVVNSIDVRNPKPEKILIVKENLKKVPLYSINSNPLNYNEFVVSGRDKFVRIYDQRSTNSPLKKFCPHSMTNTEGAGRTLHVTCAIYNHNGTEILASYNDDDIYLFDSTQPDQSEYIHTYQGHRNSSTVKGVNFFGPKSEFIVSGSDCGNIFFWDKKTEAIVQWMAGDENGVVNCLEPHPQIPILATSGLDEDVKIWVPSCEQDPKFVGLSETVSSNLKSRDGERDDNNSTFDGQMLWILWRHLRRTERMRSARRNVATSRRGSCGDPPNNNHRRQSSSSSSSDSSDDEEGRNGPQGFQCSPS